MVSGASSILLHEVPTTGRKGRGTDLALPPLSRLECAVFRSHIAEPRSRRGRERTLVGVWLLSPAVDARTVLAITSMSMGPPQMPTVQRSS